MVNAAEGRACAAGERPPDLLRVSHLLSIQDLLRQHYCTVLYCTGMYWSVAFSQSSHDAITSYDMHAGGGSTHSLLRQKHYIGHPVQAPSLLQPSRRTSEMTSSNLIGGQAVVHSTTSCSRGAGKILHT